jgi:glutamyl-tRNA reductase
MRASATDRLDRGAKALPARHARVARSAKPWLLSLDAAVSTPEERAAVATGLARAHVDRFGWLLLHTCRRIEVLGAGPRPEPATLVGLTGATEAAAMALHVGDAAVRRLARLAAGLESAVVGEDQVLGQVRQLRTMAATSRTIDPLVVGALDTAITVGRRARAGRPRTERSLAERSLAWLAAQRDLKGARLLVVGTGPIGAEAARLARRGGASVTIASRTGTSRKDGIVDRLTLGDAVTIIADVDLVVVALAGPWLELLNVRLAPAWSLPFVVDLSAPPAVQGPTRVMFGHRLATLDDLASASEGDDQITTAYRAHAERLVDEAVSGWSHAARSTAPATIAAIRALAEDRRAESFERLLRRLPELSPRQRELVEQHGRQMVAAILHKPTARLRDEADAGRVAAARDLFGV